MDKKIGKWKYWGILAAADMPEAPPDAPIQADERGMLRKGSRGNDVKVLQRALRQEGYHLEIDGIFGRITLECVKSFQATHDLVRDGIVGPLTWAALEEACK